MTLPSGCRQGSQRAETRGQWFAPERRGRCRRRAGKTMLARAIAGEAGVPFFFRRVVWHWPCSQQNSLFLPLRASQDVAH